MPAPGRSSLVIAHLFVNAWPAGMVPHGDSPESWRGASGEQAAIVEISTLLVPKR